MSALHAAAVDAFGGAASYGLASCPPGRGPRRRPVGAVAVDDELVWVVALPAVALGATLPASPAALAHLGAALAAELMDAYGTALDAALLESELVDAAARLVAGYLEDLPDLPYVGEPFGGEEGTD
jgi:hypothetical protein